MSSLITGWAALCVAILPCISLAEEVTIDALIDLPSADVYVLGEVHDNPNHHAAQAAAILVAKPSAVVFEMLSDAEARRVPAEPLSEAALADLLDWEGSGWPDFAIYYPIFVAAEGAAVYGAEAPRDSVRAAVTERAAPVFGDAAELFGLTEALDPGEQKQREQMMADAHCGALPVDLLPGMVEAQRLRDAYLARAVVAAYLETGGPVAVVAGNGHARADWGVPYMLGLANPSLEIFALGQFEAPPEGAVPYDQWIVTGAPARGDPCAAFR